jgi:hypothetical protein
MTNPYIQFPDVYGATQGNLTPYQQNISNQAQSIQQLLQQGGQLANANLGAPMSMGSSNPQQMANALRNMGQTANAYAPWTQSNISNTYGTDPYSEQSRMLAMQERGM